ncbi:MAG: hypothetical protein MI924_20880 [Chloroflexales bacterium]|nr:hypothetical protein [Chloroflexales bacterium]
MGSAWPLVRRLRCVAPQAHRWGALTLLWHISLFPPHGQPNCHGGQNKNSLLPYTRARSWLRRLRLRCFFQLCADFVQQWTASASLPARRRWPRWIRWVATPVPIITGMSYSRATIEPWTSAPPMSATSPFAWENRGVQAGVVVGQTRTCPAPSSRSLP